MTTGAADSALPNPNILADIASNAGDAIRQGRADAAEAAAKAVPVIRNTIAKGTYLSCYSVAYGAVYSAEILLGLLPDNSPIRNGFRDGAAAAREAVHQRRTCQAEQVVAQPTPTTPAATVTTEVSPTC